MILGKGKNNPKRNILHCSATTKHITVGNINDYHKTLWHSISNLGSYCGYHFVIDYLGKRYQTREIYEEGMHTIGQNRSSIGICLIMYPDTEAWRYGVEPYMPSREQEISLVKLLKEIEEETRISGISYHRDFTKLKTCPGNLIPASWGRDLIRKGKISFLKRQLFLLRRYLLFLLKKYE